MTENSPYNLDNYTYKKFKPCIDTIDVGIDEAGRGPVLGHLVYAALIGHSLNYTDSKVLTADQRNNFFKEIDSKYNYIYTAVHPNFISTNMMAKKPLKRNLNEISYDTVINMLKEIEKNYKIGTVYLDALGPIPTYHKVLITHFPKYKFIIETKCELKYGIVGGASIIAKVTRDRLLNGWDVADKNYGSGYTSDEVTRRWLDKNCKINKLPIMVRRSWATVQKYTIDKPKMSKVFKKFVSKKK